MIQQNAVSLPHGITLHCRTSGVAGRPVLLFLHGTMSSFAGSYAALAATAASTTDEGGRAAAALRQQIAQRYGAEVYAWEHRTLSESPIRNALELVKQLPDRRQEQDGPAA